MRKRNGIYYKIRHGCFLLQYELVFVMKGRRKALVGEVRECVYKTLRDGLEHQGCPIIQMDGGADYVQIRFEASPDKKLTELANMLKTRSARMTWARHPEAMRQIYGDGQHVFWTDSYFVESIGYDSPDAITRYIENQEQDQDQDQTQEET